MTNPTPSPNMPQAQNYSQSLRNSSDIDQQGSQFQK